jgi:uncharacterized protein YjdB
MKRILLFTASVALCVSAAFAQVAQIPEGYVSLYQAMAGQSSNEKAGATIGAVASLQIIGPGNGWDQSTALDVANYEKLEFKFTFDAADAGHQIVVRYSVNKAVKYKVVTFPDDGSTECVFAINTHTEDLPADANGVVGMGGIVIYNGNTHYSFSYTGTATTQAITLNYAALKTALPTAITVVPADAILAQALPVGQTTALTAQFTPVYTTNKSVTWSSANEAIATVDASTGVVTGVSGGEAAITATSAADPSITGSYTVTVATSTVAVTGVELELETVNLKMLNNATLDYTVSPANASNRNVTWASSNTAVATVDGTGKVTPVSAGTSTITVTTEDGEFTDNCAVTVIGYESIPEGYVSLYTLNFVNNGVSESLTGGDKGATVPVPAIFSSNGNKLLGNPSNWNRNSRYVDLANYDELEVACYFQTADIGKTIDFRYCFAAASLESDQSTGTTINNRAVEITSEIQKIVIDLKNDELDVEGSRRLGAIYFRNNGGEVKFNVDYVALKTVSPTALTIVPEDTELAQALPVGQTVALQAQFTPGNTTNQSVTWSSADEAIATVSASGVVTGVSVGEVVITATSVENNTVTGDYTVTVITPTVAVTGVSLDLETLSLKLLNNATLAYTVSPADASNSAVTWTSSDAAVATVDEETGEITPVSAGTATITVTTEDGEFTDACTVTVIGYESIPENYVSLYTLNFTDGDNVTSLDVANGATVPAIFSSNGGSLLGTETDWNRNNRYVDLSKYDELDIACYFQTGDTDKTIILQYTFAGASADATPSTIVEREIAITPESQKITIDLANDASDTDKLRRLGGIKFKDSVSGEVNFNLDYVALKPKVVTGLSVPASDASNAVVNVYSVTGTLVRRAVKASEATTGLSKGFYIAGNKKVLVTD